MKCEDCRFFYMDESNGYKMTDQDLVTPEMLRDLGEQFSDRITAISAVSSVGTGEAQTGENRAKVSLVGASDGYFVANSKKLLHGRYFNNDEVRKAIPAALISEVAARVLFGKEEAALSQEIQVTVGTKTYELAVVGVYSYEVTGVDALTKESKLMTEIYIPYRAAQSLNHASAGLSSFSVVGGENMDKDQLIEDIQDYLNQTYYARNEHFWIQGYSMSSLLDTFMTTLKAIEVGISAIAGISLLVGGIGVMNIMLVSVTERTREIGTRKALGAKNRDIRIQFITEAVILCIVGGIIGIVLGVALGLVGCKLMQAPGKPSISSILLSLGFSTAIGVFFGAYPANKAAKLDPIEALRYE